MPDFNSEAGTPGTLVYTQPFMVSSLPNASQSVFRLTPLIYKTRKHVHGTYSLPHPPLNIFQVVVHFVLSALVRA